MRCNLPGVICQGIPQFPRGVTGGICLVCLARRLYAEYPWVFHELYPVIYDYAKDFACFDALLKPRGALRVLDLGCGTGLLGRYLVEAGYEYAGTDLSPGMLAIARHHVPGALFVLCDMRDLAPLRAMGAGSFDAILCTGRAFGHLTTDGEVTTCLRAVVTLLRPGGIFCCDAIDADKMPADFRATNHVTTLAGQRAYDREYRNVRLAGERWTLRTEIHFIVRERGAVIAEFDDVAEYRAYSPGELHSFLSDAGLTAGFTCATIPHLPSVLLASALKTEM